MAGAASRGRLRAGLLALMLALLLAGAAGLVFLAILWIVSHWCWACG